MARTGDPEQLLHLAEREKGADDVSRMRQAKGLEQPHEVSDPLLPSLDGEGIDDLSRQRKETHVTPDQSVDERVEILAVMEGPAADPLDREAVSVRFSEPVAGSAQWDGGSLRVVDRPKYTEIVFVTLGLPQETVEMIWKLNASIVDGTVAGVVVVRPNDLRVSGEKGFTLLRSG